MHISLSGSPSTVKFSPNWPKVKIVAAQKALPIMVRVDLVDEYGAMLPAVTGEIGLRITIDIELAHHSPSRNRRLPD